MNYSFWVFIDVCLFVFKLCCFIFMIDYFVKVDVYFMRIFYIMQIEFGKIMLIDFIKLEIEGVCVWDGGGGVVVVKMIYYLMKMIFGYLCVDCLIQ